jgi:hypothetical protein
MIGVRPPCLAEGLPWRLGRMAVVVNVCLPAVLLLHVPVWDVHVVHRRPDAWSSSS